MSGALPNVIALNVGMMLVVLFLASLLVGPIEALVILAARRIRAVVAGGQE
jgi:hypothetical protein